MYSKMYKKDNTGRNVIVSVLVLILIFGLMMVCAVLYLSSLMKKEKARAIAATQSTPAVTIAKEGWN